MFSLWLIETILTETYLLDDQDKWIAIANTGSMVHIEFSSKSDRKFSRLAEMGKQCQWPEHPVEKKNEDRSGNIV